MNFPILYLHHFFRIQPDHTFSRIAQPLSLINNDIADRSPIIWLSTVNIKSYIDKFFEVFFLFLLSILVQLLYAWNKWTTNSHLLHAGWDKKTPSTVPQMPSFESKRVSCVFHSTRPPNGTWALCRVSQSQREVVLIVISCCRVSRAKYKYLKKLIALGIFWSN